MVKIIKLVYHAFSKLGGIEPPNLLAIPPHPIAAHSCLKAAEIASIEDGDSRNFVEKN